MVGGPKIHKDSVVAAWGERCQPQMHVILGTVDPVDQICDYTWILAIRRENVNIWWVGADVGWQYGFPTGAEHLQTVEADIVAVTPGGQDVDNQSLSLRKHWDLKIIIPLH